jgi:CelD/BcsL family acetyltransferase involved in cellulose biosynthesis
VTPVFVDAGSTPPPDWPELLAADVGADACHCPFWITALARHRPCAEPLWLTVREAGKVLGGLAAVRTTGWHGRLDSGPEGTAGGPVVRDDLGPERAAAVAAALVDAFLQRRGGPLRGCGIALNPLHEERWGQALVADRRLRRVAVPAAVLDLQGGEDAVAARFRKSKRNERNRGLRRGGEVFTTDDPELLTAWHELHVQACGRWGMRPLPLPLVRELLAARPGAEGGGAFFTCVTVGGRVAGGHLNLHRGHWVTAWSGVTDPAVARTHFPSTLAVWGDVREACRRGARWLDLGASGGIASLGEFKRTLGAVSRARGWYLAESWPRRLLDAAARRGRGGAERRWHDGESAP